MADEIRDDGVKGDCGWQMEMEMKWCRHQEMGMKWWKRMEMKI